MQENNILNNFAEEDGLDLGKIFSELLSHWKLFILSLVLCLSLAVVYLYFAIPQYSVSSKILLSDKERGSFSTQADMLADFGYQTGISSVENEIEVIKSMSVARGAALASGVYVSYTMLGVKDVPIYKKASPVNVVVEPEVLAKVMSPIRLYFTFDGASPVKVRTEYMSMNTGADVETADMEITSFPYRLNTEAGELIVEDIRKGGKTAFSGELLVTVNHLESTARSYISSLSVAPISKTSSVAMLSINTPVPAIGVDYINAVIESYNNVTNEDKRQVALQTRDFINSRLDLLRLELAEREGHLAKYKRDNQLIDPSLDAPQVMQKRAEYVRKLEEIDMMIESAKNLNEFVKDPSNDMKIIPTTFGVAADQSLLTLVGNYNKMVLERNNLLLTASEDNPMFKSTTLKVKAMLEDLKVALDALDKSLALQREAISIFLDSYTDRFEMSPEIERELLALTRECGIKSDLYVMMLQKYEENALSLAVSADNLRCIDAPSVGGIVSPNRRIVMLIALFLGLILPAVYIYVRMMFQTKLASVDEVLKMLPVPHIGSTPILDNLKGGADTIVVKKNVNDVVAESFRTIRTNLHFVMKNTSGKVVLFTSTTSGEGKTFVASNMAASMALLGKKVLLIGGDIRRPRLAEIFDFDKKAEGLTSYLVADMEDVSILDRSIIKSQEVEGLDLLPAGIVPPNPAEILAGRNLDAAIDYLKTKYDYIIIDSAPVGLVSDSLLISRIADSVVYILRMSYSHKEDIGFLKMLLADGKLENVSVVINAVNFKSRMYRSGRYASGGYSKYGYSYGYGYVQDTNNKKK